MITRLKITVSGADDKIGSVKHKRHTSPYSITTRPKKQVVRIKEMIIKENTKREEHPC